jgi:hypothetical protein
MGAPEAFMGMMAMLFVMLENGRNESQSMLFLSPLCALLLLSRLYSSYIDAVVVGVTLGA